MKSNTKSATTSSRKPVERAIRILEQPTRDTDGWGCIEIRMGKKVDTYLVHFIPSDFGFGAVGFEVEKIDSDLQTVENYHVHLADKPELCSCDCRGHAQHGHCKHREGLQALSSKFPKLWTARDHRHDPHQANDVQGDEPDAYDPAS
jgi:hypothetical protein